MNKLNEFTVPTARPLPVIILADVSGSMSTEGKISVLNDAVSEMIIVEHPSGVIEVKLEMEQKGDSLSLKKAGTIRTVRKIMEGFAFY